MRLYPAPHLTRVRDPRTRQIIDPIEGVELGPHDFDLFRMREDGDLVDTPPAPPAKAPVAAPPPPAKPAASASEGA